MKLRWKALIQSLAVLVAAGALACNVPVFRYALERWPADNFGVTILRRGALPPAEQAVADTMKEASEKYAANFMLRVTDVPGPTNFPLPAVTVNFPYSRGTELTAWHGPFTADTGRLLLDSPVRRELARRIVKGDSVVWLLLDGDAPTKKLLDTELRKLEKETTVPEVDPNDPRTMGNTELKIAFSVLPVSRTDPAEKLFVAMLLNAAPSLTNSTGPVAFPVFGRGRVLAALAGEELSVENINAATEYLCGACSCEIKAQNPGMDLLLAVNWEDAIEERTIQDPPLPPLVSLSSLAASAQPPPVVAADGGLRRNLFLALGVLLGVAIIGTLLFLQRQRS
jgi:hypothetical protein